jgi:hypothetical protein
MICLVLCLFFGGAKQPDKEILQREPPAAAFYRIRAKNDEKHEHALIVLIRRTANNKIELLDTATHAKLEGEFIKTATRESLFFKFGDEWKSRGAWQNVTASGLEFRRTSEKESGYTAFLTGLSGQDLELAVESLLSVWACSNHNNPTHTADSQEQMTALTAKNGCAGWHKLDTTGN